MKPTTTTTRPNAEAPSDKGIGNDADLPLPPSRPKRPLSAYNLFYRFKRNKMIDAISTLGDGKDDAPAEAYIDRDSIVSLIRSAPGLEFYPPHATLGTPPKAVLDLRRRNVLRVMGKIDQIIPRDTRDRSHRKNGNAINGAIGFIELGKMMKEAWLVCDDFAKDVFRELAERGRAHYRVRLERYKIEVAENKRAKAKAKVPPAVHLVIKERGEEDRAAKKMKMAPPSANNLNGSFGNNNALRNAGTGAALPSLPLRRVSPPVCVANFGDGIGVGHQQQQPFHRGARATTSAAVPPTASTTMMEKTSLSNVERVLLAQRAIQGRRAAAAAVATSTMEEASLLRARLRALDEQKNMSCATLSLNDGSTAGRCRNNNISFQGRRIEHHNHQTIQGQRGTAPTMEATFLRVQHAKALEGQIAAERMKIAAERMKLSMRAKALEVEDKLLLASSRNKAMAALEEELLLATSRTDEAGNKAMAALKDELLLATNRTNKGRTIETTEQRSRPMTTAPAQGAVAGLARALEEEDKLLLAISRSKTMAALEEELLLASSRTDEARTIEIMEQRRQPTKMAVAEGAIAGPATGVITEASGCCSVVATAPLTLAHHRILEKSAESVTKRKYRVGLVKVKCKNGGQVNKLRVLPPHFKFPSMTSSQLIESWFIGDLQANIPPLCTLAANNVSHIKGASLVLRKMKRFMLFVEKIGRQKKVWGERRVSSPQGWDIRAVKVLWEGIQKEFKKKYMPNAKRKDISWRTPYNNMNGIVTV